MQGCAAIACRVSWLAATTPPYPYHTSTVRVNVMAFYDCAPQNVFSVTSGADFNLKK